MWSVVMAVLYRDTRVLKRRMYAMISLYIIPIIFSLAIVYAPAAVTSPSQVLQRFRLLTNLPIENLSELLALMLYFSSIISITAIGTSTAYWVAEDDVHEVLYSVLKYTTLSRYVLAELAVAPLQAVISTIYLVPATIPLIGVVKSVMLYLMYLPIAVVAMSVLMIYGYTIGLLIVRLLRTSEVWIVSNWLLPLILLASGIYIPLSLIPAMLRYFAYTTPVPYIMEIAKLILVFRSLSTQVPIVLLTFVATIYVIATMYLARSCEYVLKREGILCLRRM